jgi:nucleoside 2-deoxyribosyltransferase
MSGGTSSVELIKLTLCGPTDVAKEFALAAEAINEWNCQHGEQRGFWVKHQHWSTDSYPDAQETGQGAINKQLIDSTDILVAIFWSRIGTPTASAESGTVEEIQRAIAAGKKVMVYFSDRDPLPAGASIEQVKRLSAFREQLRTHRSCWTVRSRSRFRDDFANHLALVLNDFPLGRKGRARSKPADAGVRQSARGTGNLQIAGDGNEVHQYQRPPVIKTVLERRPGSITAAEEHQVAEWIKDLAEGTMGKSRNEAYGEWGARFLGRFKVPKREALLSADMPAVEAWYRQQKALQKRGYKTKAPDQWRASRIRAIKAAMTSMGKVNENYYPELADRLNIKRAFTSLTGLTKTDLDRVYQVVLRDSRR